MFVARICLLVRARRDANVKTIQTALEDLHATCLDYLEIKQQEHALRSKKTLVKILATCQKTVAAQSTPTASRTSVIIMFVARICLLVRARRDANVKTIQTALEDLHATCLDYLEIKQKEHALRSKKTLVKILATCQKTVAAQSTPTASRTSVIVMFVARICLLVRARRDANVKTIQTALEDLHATCLDYLEIKQKEHALKSKKALVKILATCQKTVAAQSTPTASRTSVIIMFVARTCLPARARRDVNVKTIQTASEDLHATCLDYLEVKQKEHALMTQDKNSVNMLYIDSSQCLEGASTRPLSAEVPIEARGWPRPPASSRGVVWREPPASVIADTARRIDATSFLEGIFIHI
ncbi:uncharacterized protein LOC122378147 isoform X3 [Amphibalanus amphitrite]|nr:uncharacterized protein LOC122378147 isoform X3 [Amphibalanus amphitrite]